jgi:nucleoside-diphosphate-sugar epimerase
MKLLLTGYSGFVGSELRKQLVSANMSFSTLGRTEISEAEKHFPWTLGLDPNPQIFEDIDVLIHLAWKTDERHSSANHLNIGGSQKLIESARLSGVKVFFISSLAAENPLSCYGAAKLKVEKINSLGVNIRLPKLVGQIDSKHTFLIWKLIKKLTFLPASQRVFVNVGNLTEGVLAIIETVVSNCKPTTITLSHRRVTMNEYIRRFLGFQAVSVPMFFLETIFALLHKLPAQKSKNLEDRWVSLKSSSGN